MAIVYGLIIGVTDMHRIFPSLLLLLLLAGCSRTDRGTEIPEGHLELVWAVQPESAEEEPWFGSIANAAVGNNRIYIADTGRTTIICLDRHGTFVRTIGREGDGPGEFNRPRRVFVSPDGSLFVQRRLGGELSQFTSGGEFIKVHRHQDIIAGAGFGGIEFPVAINDTTIVWEVSPFPFGLSVEEELQTPSLISICNNQWETIAERSLTEELDSYRQTLIDAPDNSLIWEFTRIVHGSNPGSGEVFFVRKCNPYSVTRVVEGRPPTTFDYNAIEEDDWVKVIATPYQEFREKQRSKDDRRYLGEYIILGTQRPPPIHRGFTYSHTSRGMAISNSKLVLYVEELHKDFPELHSDEGGIIQKLFVVDLDTEQAEMLVTFQYPYPIELQGALEDGTLIFSTNDPVPGILAYRIVPN
ncbi:6-bladed beta-propeller [Gemmatimonadota bacterium]